MRGHADIERLLAVYRSLDAPERHLVDAHVKTCDVCTVRRSAYTEMDQHLSGLEDPPPPRGLSRALERILRGERPTGRVRERVAHRPLLSQRVLLPVGLLLLLILGVWFIWRVSTFIGQEIAETPSATPTTTPPSAALRACPELVEGTRLVSSFGFAQDASGGSLLPWRSALRGTMPCPGSETGGTAVVDRPLLRLRSGPVSARLEIVRATPVVLRPATPLALRTGVVSH